LIYSVNTINYKNKNIFQGRFNYIDKIMRIRTWNQY